MRIVSTYNRLGCVQTSIGATLLRTEQKQTISTNNATTNNHLSDNEIRTQMKSYRSLVKIERMMTGYFMDRLRSVDYCMSVISTFNLADS